MQTGHHFAVLVSGHAATVDAHAERLERQAAKRRTISFHKWAQDAMITGASPVFGTTGLKG
eukprot:7856440-Pyramimonas_sp.AAC.1